MRHLILGRPALRGATPRRLAAARRALKRERGKLPLFADQVRAEQETAAERVSRYDLQLLTQDQGIVTGRQVVAQDATAAKRRGSEIREKWEQSSIPARGAYFADFVRTELRKRGIQTE